MKRRRLGLGLAALLAAPAPMPVLAQAAHVERVDVIEAVPDVPGKVGAELALTVRASGRPPGATVTLREVWRLPAPGARDPASGAAILESASQVETRLGDNFRRSYPLDQPWKIVRGDWQVEYWDGIRKLAVRRFVVR